MRTPLKTIARANIIRPLLTATLGLAITFTISCGDHGFDDIFGYQSSSSAGGTSASSSSVGSSSSWQSSSSFANVGSNLLENVPYETGSLPVGETGFIDVQINNAIISGGSIILAVTSSKYLGKLYIQFAGDNGYYIVDISESNLTSFVNGVYTYNVLLQLTQNLLAGQSNMHFSGLATNSQVSSPVARNVESIKVGSGALQVSLSWDTKVDLDLYVTTPSGGTIYYSNKKVGNGELDLDANVGCPSNGKSNENIFFTAPLADGDYTVAVEVYTNCITTSTNYMVSAYSNGNSFGFSDLQRGEFTGSSSNRTRKTIGIIRIKDGIVVPYTPPAPVTYEGETYKTVVIGTQTWMARNLNYNAAGSKCYDNDPANCETYGRLYDWETAKAVCPTGWHLPSDAEWTTLTTFVGNTPGTKLKSASGWNSSGNGTDDYGFSALPGGDGNSSNGGFSFFGERGSWWSGTEYNASLAYIRYMTYNSGVSSYNGDKADLYSVRCLED